MHQNIFVRSCLIAASAAIFIGSAAAQTKVAVVNMQQAVLQTAEIKKASAELEANYKPRQAEMERLRKELEDIQQKLQAGQGKLTQQAEADLTVQAQRKQRDLQRMGQDLQEEVDAERNDILGRSGGKMAGVVRKIAEERGIDVVVDMNTAVYYKPVLDLTKDAVVEFDKAYPVK